MSKKFFLNKTKKEIQKKKKEAVSPTQDVSCVTGQLNLISLQENKTYVGGGQWQIKSDLRDI